jgi:hypothetical protein
MRRTEADLQDVKMARMSASAPINSCNGGRCASLHLLWFLIFKLLVRASLNYDYVITRAVCVVCGKCNSVCGELCCNQQQRQRWHQCGGWR